ncbi:hypothetical protein BDD12DRAFT_822876 [Trichophaea hybrida]|nr:hypothetical protein BDD12DRAFT_822876 [Trichophaea hybrida]
MPFRFLVPCLCRVVLTTSHILFAYLATCSSSPSPSTTFDLLGSLLGTVSVPVLLVLGDESGHWNEDKEKIVVFVYVVMAYLDSGSGET